MAPWMEGLQAAGAVGGGAGVWRFLSLPVYRWVAVFSKRTDRRRYALEVLRMARKDAADIPSYLPSVTPQAETRSPVPAAGHGLTRHGESRT